MFNRLLVFASLCLFASAFADTPANCTHGDFLGTWMIYETQRGLDSTENCSESFRDVVRKFQVTLNDPDKAVDEYGNQGFWTVVYNQGFELVINQRKYFAFSYYEKHTKRVTSYCDSTFPGWSHDVLSKNWACFRGKKLGQTTPKMRRLPSKTNESGRFIIERAMRKSLNYVKNWRSIKYEEFSRMSYDELLKLSGGPASKVVSPPKSAPITMEQREIDSTLPSSWDWRNVSNKNYVTPIRNQGACGSCYAFASMALLESRLKIATENRVNVVLSPQDVVGCSEYSQGCEGGFPYLIGGKYGQDFGVVPENCFPYVGEDSACTEKKCLRYYVSDYSYIGGYFGACNEVVMREALFKRGPIAIGFEVTDDFMTYKSGIYHENKTSSTTNTFQETNHAVLVVGYGTDEESKMKYWIVKNSWGEQWGEQGYFRIRRGKDDLHIESMAVEATPIPY